MGERGWERRVVRVRAVLDAGIITDFSRKDFNLAMGVALWILAEASSKAVVSGDSD